MTAMLLTLFIVAVLLNGLFAGYETGFVSADRIRLRYLAEKMGNSRARRLLQHVGNPDGILTTLLVGTNIALIAGTMALTRQVKDPWIAQLIATPVFLVFAEVMPKSIFRRHPVRLSLAAYPFVQVSDVVLAPIVFPITLCLRAMRWIAGSAGRQLNPIMATEQDFRNLVDASAAHGSIEPEEREMIHSVMDLQTISAKEIMVPRIDIEALPDTATRSEVMQVFQESGRTRIPIYVDTIDSIIGVVNVYDFLGESPEDDGEIARFVREVIHVPDTVPVDDLLQQLKQARQHLAIVTDEYGGTDGLVTLEDVLEEIFGEIQDEHDSERDMIQRVGPFAFVVDARMPLEDFEEAIGVEVKDEEVETVGGWVMHAAGRIPAQGEKIKHAGFRVTILDGGVNQVSKVRIDILAEHRGAVRRKPKEPPADYTEGRNAEDDEGV